MIRMSALLAPAAALTLVLTLGACTPAEQESAEAEAAQTGDEIQEEAEQVGAVIEAGAREVAQEVDQATDEMAEGAEEVREDTRAEGERTE